MPGNRTAHEMFTNFSAPLADAGVAFAAASLGSRMAVDLSDLLAIGWTQKTHTHHLDLFSPLTLQQRKTDANVFHDGVVEKRKTQSGRKVTMTASAMQSGDDVQIER